MSKARRAKSAARRLPAHMQDVAFTKGQKRGWAKQRKGLGRFGAASEVRHIGPRAA